MTPTPETNTECFRDTIIAYRAVRQSGEKDLPAYYSERDANRRHRSNVSDEARKHFSDHPYSLQEGPQVGVARCWQ